MGKHKWTEKTPETLFRSGSKSDNKMDHVRTQAMVDAGICAKPDVGTYEKNGAEHVEKLSGGISLFNSISRARRWWYRIPSRSAIPVGLVLVANFEGEEAVPGTHYQLEPLVDMPMRDFKRLLKEVQIEADPIDAKAGT